MFLNSNWSLAKYSGEVKLASIVGVIDAYVLHNQFTFAKPSAHNTSLLYIIKWGSCHRSAQ